VLLLGDINAEVLSELLSLLKEELVISQSGNFEGPYSDKWSCSPEGSL